MSESQMATMGANIKTLERVMKRQGGTAAAAAAAAVGRCRLRTVYGRSGERGASWSVAADDPILSDPARQEPGQRYNDLRRRWLSDCIMILT